MKRKMSVYLLILSLIFNLAFLGALGYRIIERKKWLAARAERAEREKKGFHEWLKLTEEQIAKLDEIRNKFPSQIRPLRNKMDEERKKLGPMLRQDPPDTSHIVAHLQSIGRLQVDIEKEIVFQVLREKAVLSPEQSEQYLKMVERHLGGNSFRGRSSGPPRRGESERRPNGRENQKTDRDSTRVKEKEKEELPW
jgi:Spy/CpxP family protein refolding chaperone